MRINVSKSAFVLSVLLLGVGQAGCGDSGDSGATGGAAGAAGSGASGGSGGTGGSAGGGGVAGGGAGGAAGSAGASGSGGNAGQASIDCSAGDILAYNFGNQITGSNYNVSSAGVVAHSERTCCPPTETDQNDPPLDATTLGKLKGWIEAAKTASVLSKDGAATREGSTSGMLEACAEDGTPFIIRDVVRNDSAGGLDTIYYNTASEAEEIRAFVTDIVDQDMPGG